MSDVRWIPWSCGIVILNLTLKSIVIVKGGDLPHDWSAENKVANQPPQSILWPPLRCRLPLQGR